MRSRRRRENAWRRKDGRRKKKSLSSCERRNVDARRSSSTSGKYIYLYLGYVLS
jgi:hypothetical protein